MNTGTCKGVLSAALIFGLAACDQISAFGFDAASDGGGTALQSASLVGGAVKVTPPHGFCVDQSSLQSDFALIARCESLENRPGLGGPVAVMTAAAIVASETDRADPQVFEGSAEEILQQDINGQVFLAQVKGAPVSSGMNSVFWRATTRIGNHIVGLALYEPLDAPGLGDAAPALLTQTAMRMREGSPKAPADLQDNSATPESKQSGGGFFAGLFQRNLSLR